jgi:ribosomal protein S12 methylthiotransferase accessory factor
VAQLAGDFHRRTSYRPTLPKYTTLEEAAYLMTPGPLTPLDRLPNLSRPNLKDEIGLCLTALSRLGLEVLVVNTTHSALNLPAVYVLVPGTHFLDRTRNTTVIFHLAKTAALYAPPLEALAALAELNAAFPHRFDVHFFLGLALENQGRPGEALEHFHRALALNPPAHEVPSIYVHLGTCQKDLGYFQEALAAFTQALELDPNLKEAHHLLGFCYFKLEEYQQAVECFEKVIELDPGSAIDYANLGINLQRLGHAKEAGFVLQQALELDPTLDFAARALEALQG